MLEKVIFLVDMNAFFISCEMTRKPSLKGKPAAVAGNPKARAGIILAANYEARAYGVKTAMTLREATELCPVLQLVPPDHKFYKEMSDKVMGLLSRFTPLVEQNSIDEAWLDMTGTEKLFGPPLDAAQRIMDEIINTIGIWCSIGISENKFLAKMASDMKKPLGITELWKKDLATKLWPLPVEKMHGVGSKTAGKLKLLGIQTIGDLAKSDKNILVKTLGKHGQQLFLHANGLGDSSVQPHAPDDVKSIGRSTTLPEDIRDLAKAKIVLLELAESVGATARMYDKKGTTVQITIKYSDFKVITRQESISPSFVTSEIYDAGCRLLEENWDTKKAVRLLGLTLTGFDKVSPCGQLSIFDLIDGSSVDTGTSAKLEQIDRTLDEIRSKYGSEKVVRASKLALPSKQDFPDKE